MTVASPREAEAGPEVVEVEIRALAAGGDGIGDLPDGRVVFVPRTVPGDRAHVRVRRARARWATGSLVSIEEPGPGRVEPACTRYAECGGCQLQHLAYAEQLRWKGRFVADALTRIGHLEGVEPPEVVGSPDELHYRNRVTYTLRRLGGGRVVAGFHALDPGHRVVDLQAECRLPVSELAEAWLALRRGWGPGARLLPSARRLRLTLRTVRDGVDLVVQGGRRGWNAHPILDAVGLLRAVWHRTDSGSGGAELVAGSRSVGGGTAFEQVNAPAARLLRAYVLTRCEELLEGRAGGTIVDAYCGAGEYGRPLARTGHHVVGIELDPEAVSAARNGAPEGLQVMHAPVEDALPGALPADLLVVNPPRSGLDPSVTASVLTGPPPALVYVSCDPATLARDLAALGERYELRSLRAFDLFPQTAHVESVAVLTAREAA